MLFQVVLSEESFFLQFVLFRVVFFFVVVFFCFSLPPPQSLPCLNNNVVVQLFFFFCRLFLQKYFWHLPLEDLLFTFDINGQLSSFFFLCD